MIIQYSPTFKRLYRKLQEEVKISTERKEKIFRDNPFDSRLKTHKLHGRLAGLFSFSINIKYRIIFEFDVSDKNIVHFHAIGTHDIYE